MQRYDERDDKFIKFEYTSILSVLRWTRHVMRLEESDSAQKLVCTKPGRNGDAGEQSSGRAKRYSRTTQRLGAEIGEVAEAH